MNEKSKTYERKDKKINIKVTEQERELIHQIARKLGYNSTSKYLLKVAKNPVVFMQNDDVLRELSTNIQRIGTNINQVARKINIQDYVMQQDLQEIKTDFNQLRAYLILIKEFHFFEKTTLEEIFKYGHY